METGSTRELDRTTGAVSIRRSSSNALATALIMVVTGALIFSVAYLSNQSSPASRAGGATSVTVTGVASGTAPAIGQLAPDFAVTTTDGEPMKLSDLRGHPVWLTFGASWCQPCRAENPDIEAAYRALQGAGVEVVQVYMAEDGSTVGAYTKRVGITYRTVPDPDQRLAAEYRILAIPSHFFIDASGKLVRREVGSLDPSAMRAAVAQIGG